MTDIEQQIDNAIEVYGPARDMTPERREALIIRENQARAKYRKNEIAISQREQRALDLVVLGATYAQIATQVGVKTAGGARALVTRAIAKRAAQNAEAAESARVMFSERLELLYRRWMPIAMGGQGRDPDVQAAKLVLDMLNRFAEINGLKTMHVENHTTVTVQNADEKRAEIVRQIAEFRQQQVIDGEVA